MPELPEVETIRRQLDQVLKGKVVGNVEVLREKSFSGDSQKIRGWRIKAVNRRSKIIEILFEDKKEMLIIHLKMTGQLIYADGNKRVFGGHPTPDWIQELPSRHTRVVITFGDNTKLFFNDMRVFGWIKLVDKKEYEIESRSKVPDVVDKEFTLEYFFNILKNSKKPVKVTLLDQDKIGGLGNIYVNDALFLAKIRPDRRPETLTENEVKELYKACIEVINLGIKYGGASSSNYVQVTGLGGTYQDHFLVYKKDGQSCGRCGGSIKKTKLAGRGTFYCDNCQK